MLYLHVLLYRFPLQRGQRKQRTGRFAVIAADALAADALVRSQAYRHDSVGFALMQKAELIRDERLPSGLLRLY